jgi:sugar fermentation stimulation protein A
MRFPSELMPAILIRRYKRFLADVELPDGGTITAHCPNSGTMKTVSDPGSKVWISKSDNPKRKLAYTLELVCCGPSNVPALVNTARPNHVVREALEQGLVEELRGYERIRSEVKIGESRLDLLLEGGPSDAPVCYIEVKNVTMSEQPGLVIFPDAGVEILAYRARIDSKEIRLVERIPVDL